MKYYLTGTILMIVFSSCLKQSIPDAMLGSTKGTTATLSYKINGNAVNISVDDADNQSVYSGYTLSVTKNAGYYVLAASGSTGEITLSLFTDSLRTGNYKYISGYGPIFVTDYNNTNEYVYAPYDSTSVNITSYHNGHIDGNFSGVLTPMVQAGNPYDTFGTPGSVTIKDGSFKNVPVFY